MSPPWKKLRGDELSAYAASIQASDQWGDFAKHLAKHGTLQDFNNFVERDRRPLEKCLAVFADHPTAALDWIVQHLQHSTQTDPKLISQTHYTIAKFVCDNMSQLGECARAVFQHIDLKKMERVHQRGIIKPLLHSGLHHIIEQDWEMYKPLLDSFTPAQLENHVMFAAYFGFNLHERIHWSPTYYKNTEDLFVACCVGGLLQAAKNLHLSEKKHAVIVEAFVKTSNPLNKIRAANCSEVLNHLWDTYPNTPWHSSLDVWHVLGVCPTLDQKIVGYFQRTAPHALEQHVGVLACKAVEDNNTPLFNVVFPFVPSEDQTEVVARALFSRRKAILKTVLALPNGEQVFHQTLNECSLRNETRQWAENFSSTLQRRALEKSIKTIDAPQMKRKM